MVEMPRDVPVTVHPEVVKPERSLFALIAAAVTSRVRQNVAAYLKAEVERQVQAERDSFLLVLAHLAERYGELAPDGTATLRVPDAALLQDRPTVDTWRDPADLHTVYRVCRGQA